MDKGLYIRTTEHELKELRNAALIEQRTVSNFIRVLIARHIKKQEAKK